MSVQPKLLLLCLLSIPVISSSGDLPRNDGISDLHEYAHNEIRSKAFDAYAAGNYEQAVSLYNRLDPEKMTPADFANHGQAEMALGNYERGMELFEQRFSAQSAAAQKLPNRLTARMIQERLAQQRPNLDGITIAIPNEDGTGVGDGFAFLGYASVLKEHGARVLVQVPPYVQNVYKTQTTIADDVFSTKEELPPSTVQIYPMSLPAVCSTQGLTPVKTAANLLKRPYIVPQESEIAEWHKKFQGRKVIPICWNFSGNTVPGGRMLQRAVPVRFITSLQQQFPHAHFVNVDGRPVLSQEEFDQLPPDKQAEKKFDVADNAQSIEHAKDLLAFTRVAALFAYVKRHGGALVSCDTGALSLAGAVGCPAIGIVNGPAHTDARWGTIDPDDNGKPSRLFDSVRMYTTPNSPTADDYERLRPQLVAAIQRDCDPF